MNNGLPFLISKARLAGLGVLDVALKVRYDFTPHWHASLGYRTLEGGADNDEVYTFAWLHYALAEVGYQF